METDAIGRTKRIFIRSLLGVLILGILTCKQPFSLTEMLDERAVELPALVVSPSEATLYINSSLTLNVSGGEAPYDYTVSEGEGTVNSAGVYTAASTAGTAVVTVTDAEGRSVSAALTITDEQVNADYVVQSISGPGTFNAGDPIAQTFIYENTGADDGILTVYWNVYVSDDTELDGGDSLVDAGSGAALSSAASSASQSINGNWPASAGIYYLIVKISSGDDTAPDNNASASAAFTVQALGGEIDYVATGITRNYPVVTEGSLCAETFDVSNIGGSAGSQPVTWIAYASADQTIGGDEVIASGTASAGGLAAGASVNDISISGAWPSDGTWYLLIGVAATDETITGNNTGSSSDTITVNAPPDYTILDTDVVMQSSGTAGTAFAGGGSFSFIISESDNNPGTQPVAWEAFVSLDNILDGSDVSVLDGVISPLAAGGTSGVLALDSAVWPAFGSFYYLIITVDSGDDADPVNNTYISVDTVRVPEVTAESGVNSSVGPSPPNTFSNVSSLTVGGGTLSENQLVMADGLMDDPGEFDTYEITSDASTTRWEIFALWSSGNDDIDFHVWDLSGSVWDYTDGTADEEPNLPPPAKINLPAGSYYIGVEFKASAVAGSSYELFIQGR